MLSSKRRLISDHRHREIFSEEGAKLTYDPEANAAYIRLQEKTGDVETIKSATISSSTFHPAGPFSVSSFSMQMSSFCRPTAVSLSSSIRKAARKGR
jgi:Protein of unknown function (DUF2283)